MCGRFQFTKEAFAAMQDVSFPKYIQGELPLGMIYPSKPAVIVEAKDHHLEGSIADFGIKTEFNGKKKQLINARSETVFDKYMFKFPIRHDRILIPVSCFYEWDAAKNMISFTENKQPVFYLAGFKLEDGFIILTTDANASMRPFHHRMPVIVKEEDRLDYLENEQAAKKILKEIPPALLSKPVHMQTTLF